MVVIFEPPIQLQNAMTLDVLFSLGTRKYTLIEIKLERKPVPISIDGLFKSKRNKNLLSQENNKAQVMLLIEGVRPSSQ